MFSMVNRTSSRNIGLKMRVRKELMHTQSLNCKKIEVIH